MFGVNGSSGGCAERLGNMFKKKGSVCSVPTGLQEASERKWGLFSCKFLQLCQFFIINQPSSCSNQAPDGLISSAEEVPRGSVWVFRATRAGVQSRLWFQIYHDKILLVWLKSINNQSLSHSHWAIPGARHWVRGGAALCRFIRGLLGKIVSTSF